MSASRMRETIVRVRHEPTGREATVYGCWGATQHKLRKNAIELLMSRAWRDANDPAVMEKEVARYELPDNDPWPDDLGKYRAGPALGPVQRGEGEA